MYEILYFPTLIKNAETYISVIFEQDFPPFSDGFEERQYQYSTLGLIASKLTEKLIAEYNIPKKQIPNWDSASFMASKRDEIEKLRSQKEI